MLAWFTRRWITLTAMGASERSSTTPEQGRNLPAMMVTHLEPETYFSRIPVLATLQAVEHGAELLLTRRLVCFEAVSFSCQACDALREAGAALRGEYAPAEEPVGVFEVRVLLAAVEMALEQRVQSLSFSQ
jgi:hypothetical protein